MRLWCIVLGTMILFVRAVIGDDSAGFPDALRRVRPVSSIEDAVVYSVNESTVSEYALNLARQSGSDVLIRGWFKWNHGPNVMAQKDYVDKAHSMGALFGGGITCSALYDGENGLERDVWMDMVTRGADGNLVDAWGQPGIRHGSLSSPAYMDYLFRWCREQIDAGADYLFMDENNAALRGNEGYDDYSCRDFCKYLTTVYEETKDWSLNDKRWASSYKIDIANKAICSDVTMSTFSYRDYLAVLGVANDTITANNPLSSAWHEFRQWRDDRAWKNLTDRIRAHAAKLGRKVYISGNGFSPYVDLQVLGVWGRWVTKNGHIDLSSSQMEIWRGVVCSGQEMAGREVPVVLFHDWGFGTPPFPFLGVPPEERCIWMRTRGAEIYAAGGFFAFPVLGPFGCDAGRDGTIREMARQSAFYHQYSDIYLKGKYLGTRSVVSGTPNVSLAVWRGVDDKEILVHVINRNFSDGQLKPCANVVVHLPLAVRPAGCEAVSPDWSGEQPVDIRMNTKGLELILPRLEAYAIVRIRLKGATDITALSDLPRISPSMHWERPKRNEFSVTTDGKVVGAADLNGYLQGKLHTDLRNPPTFIVDIKKKAVLNLLVNSVSSTGARLRCVVDGQEIGSVDLPDRDGKNDGSVNEYAKEVSFELPQGHHRVLVENVGADWLTVDWYEFNLGAVSGKL